MFLDSVTRFIRTQIPYIFLFIRYKFFYSEKPVGDQPAVIISLTSHPARYKYLRKTLISLLFQKANADFVIQVNLWSDDYKSLPKNIRGMQSSRLQFFEVKENMRVFLKLLPTVHREPWLPIVTADDDIFYKSSWLGNLYEEHLHDGSVSIGYRACLFEHSSSYSIPAYSDWPEITQPMGPSDSIFLTGVGGVLYPPSWFKGEDLDFSLPELLCPSNDDLWYFFLARHKCKKFKKIFGTEYEPLYWFGSQRTALWKNNVTKNVNDEFVRNLLVYFKY